MPGGVAQGFWVGFECIALEGGLEEFEESEFRRVVNSVIVAWSCEMSSFCLLIF